MTAMSALSTIETSREFTDVGLAALVSQLQREGQLNGAMLVHAVCMGHASFFRHALAALSGASLSAVMAALSAPGQLAALWRKAGLANGFLPAIEDALAAMAGCDEDKPAVLLAEVIAGPGVPVTIH